MSRAFPRRSRSLRGSAAADADPTRVLIILPSAGGQSPAPRPLSRRGHRRVRSRCPASGSVALVLAPISLVLLVAALTGVAWTTGPESLLPTAGRAFTPASHVPSAPTAPGAPCNFLAGPAGDVCRGRQAQDSPAPESQRQRTVRTATTALGIGALATGVGALVVLRRRP